MQFDTPIPFIEHLGVELLHQETGHVVTALSLRPELENSWHVAHGGVTMTLLDVTAGLALRTTGDATDGVATISLSVSFIAPGRGRLVCEGRLVRRGRTISTCESEVRDETGNIVAKALGSFVLRKRRES